MWAIVVKEFRQLRRDRRTVAMLFALPFLFLVVFGYAASFDVEEIPTLVVGASAELVESRLPEQFAVVDVRPSDGRAAAEEALRRGEAVVAFVTPASADETADGADRRRGALRRPDCAAQTRRSAGRRRRPAGRGGAAGRPRRRCSP